MYSNLPSRNIGRMPTEGYSEQSSNIHSRNGSNHNIMTMDSYMNINSNSKITLIFSTIIEDGESQKRLKDNSE